MVKGVWGGGVVGREWCKIGNGCGIGGVEELFVNARCEDEVVPKEGEMIICQGWGRWWGESGNGVVVVKKHDRLAGINIVGGG